MAITRRRDLKEEVVKALEGRWDSIYAPYLRGRTTVVSGKGGRSELLTNCPFPGHPDKNPSFQFDPVSGEWTCWSKCGFGSGFDFIMKVKGVDFTTALHELAGIAGISIGEPVKQAKRKASKQRPKLTLAEYAKAKQLPKEFLESLGLTDGIYINKKNGKTSPAIKIPFLGPEGELLRTKNRLTLTAEGKGIRFIWDDDGNNQYLYGLWRDMPGDWALLVEGESDCHTLWYYGIPAYGVPGDNSYKAEWTKYLTNRETLYLWKEHGISGETFIDKTPVGLREGGFAGKILIASIPEFDDVSDLHQTDPKNFKTRLEAALKEAREPDPAEVRAAQKSTTTEEEPEEQLTQNQLLIQLASDAMLFHTENDEAYATFPVGSHKETWPLRTGGFRRWLRKRFYESEEKAPGNQALQDAIGVLEAQAYFDGPELPVYTRLAEQDGKIYLDLCNEAWEVVEISPTGWKVLIDSPIKFRRAKGMLPLPHPEKDGSIEDLRPFVNVPDEQDWRLLVAWLVAAMRPSGPYPVLVLHGEQGSAKSTTARVLRSLVDPNVAPLRTAPQDERDLAITAINSWVLTYDNLSGVPLWLSDALCRVATGGGFATRTLYEDAEETIFDYMRPVAVNGIDEIVARHDLLDRSLIITLPKIPENERQEAMIFWERFEQVRPRILGALLDAVSVGLTHLPETRLSRLPRMADFAKWISAAEPALPWEKGGFMEAYDDSRADAVAQALQADCVAVAVMDFLDEKQSFEGTATELLDSLESYVSEKTQKTRSWPKTARTLSNRLRRAATFLRQTGIEVEFEREHGGDRRRIVRITQDSIEDDSPF